VEKTPSSKGDGVESGRAFVILEIRDATFGSFLRKYQGPYHTYREE